MVPAVRIDKCLVLLFWMTPSARSPVLSFRRRLVGPVARFGSTAEWLRALSSGIGAGSPGGTCLRSSGPGRSCGNGTAAIAVLAPGDRLLATLLTDAGDRGMMDWAVSVDLTINRAHQHATNLPCITGGSVELHEFARRASCIMRSAVPAAGYPRRSAPWSTGRTDRWCC